MDTAYQDAEAQAYQNIRIGGAQFDLLTLVFLCAALAAIGIFLYIDYQK